MMFSKIRDQIKKKPNSGFTLIELLVVIAIIGVLASVTMAALNDARATARDAKRMQEVRQMATALELHYNDYGYYATDLSCTDSSWGWGCAPLSQSNPPSWHPSNGLRLLEVRGYIDKLPHDPINDENYRYWYEPHCRIHGSSHRRGYSIYTRLESTGELFRYNAGIQSDDPNCHELCATCY